MSTVETSASYWSDHDPPTANRGWHRIAEVREQQGLSLRSVARQMGTDVRRLRAEEDPTSDLKLSDLYRWQRVLGVPIEELLVDPQGPLSPQILNRARLVRVMKTVKALHETVKSAANQRLADTIMLQLIEIMPELKEVGPWHSVGQRRSLDEYGRAAYWVTPEDFTDHDSVY